MIMRALFVRYAQTNIECKQFKSIINNELLEKHKEEYNTKLDKILDFYKNDLTNKKIIEYFKETHIKLYEVFKKTILGFDQPMINGDYDMYIRKYTGELVNAMELTVVEAASIDRLLNDGAVYVTSGVINAIINKKINIIENIINVTGIKPETIIFAEDGLNRYEYLFVDLVNRRAV